MEQFGSIAKDLVRCNNRAGFFIPVRNKSEEQITFFPCDGRITRFINDNQGGFEISPSFTGIDCFMVFSQFQDQIRHVGEIHTHTGLAGFESKATARCVLPIPRGPRKITLPFSRVKLKSNSPMIFCLFRLGWKVKSNSSMLFINSSPEIFKVVSIRHSSFAATSSSRSSSRGDG